MKQSRRRPLTPRVPQDEDFDGMPDTITRRCTDVGCAIIFLSCCCTWAYAMMHCLQCGDLDRLWSIEVGNGNPCIPGSSTPFLFFCRNTSGAYNLNRPICRQSCPIDKNSSVLGCGGVPDYATAPSLSMVCLPRGMSEGSRGHVKTRTKNVFISLAAESSALAMICLKRWRSLAACAVIAILASYIMIYVLENNANCLVRFGLISLSLGCLFFGCYLLHMFDSIGLVPAPTQYRFVGALVLLVLGFLFLCVLASMSDSVQAACDCIELACKCVMQTPILTAQPLVAACLHVLSSFVSVYAILMIMSCGEEHFIEGVESFSMSWLNISCLTWFVLMWLWFHQVTFAIGEFVIAYAGALWYFTAGSSSGALLPRWTLVHSYWTTLRYHFGTLVVGGAVVSWSRLLRMPLGLLVSWTSMENPIGRFFHHLCCCFSGFYEMMSPLSKNAFIDVAMNARPFYEAANCAEYVVRRENDTIHILHGATWLFQLAGLSANAGLGASAMLFSSMYVTHDDPKVTLVMACAGAFTSAMTAMPFSMIFDTVSDTILYCSVIEQIWASRERDSSRRRTKNMAARFCPCVYRAYNSSNKRRVEQFTQPTVLLPESELFLTHYDFNRSYIDQDGE